MKKINCLFVFLGFMLAFPMLCKADCSYERQAELSRIASNVGFSYTYEIENGYPIFTVTITNLTNDIYIKDDEENVIRSNTEFSTNYRYKNSVIYDIYSNDGNCMGEKLTTSYMSFPVYNVYSSREECKKYPKFNYCQVWYNTTSLSNEKFAEEIEKYSKKNEIKHENNNISLQQIISENLKNVGVLFIGIVLIILLIYFKRRKKL